MVEWLLCFISCLAFLEKLNLCDGGGNIWPGKTGSGLE